MSVSLVLSLSKDERSNPVCFAITGMLSTSSHVAIGQSSEFLARDRRTRARQCSEDDIKQRFVSLRRFFAEAHQPRQHDTVLPRRQWRNSPFPPRDGDGRIVGQGTPPSSRADARATSPRSGGRNRVRTDRRVFSPVRGGVRGTRTEGAGQALMLREWRGILLAGRECTPTASERAAS